MVFERLNFRQNDQIDWKKPQIQLKILKVSSGLNGKLFIRSAPHNYRIPFVGIVPLIGETHLISIPSVPLGRTMNRDHENTKHKIFLFVAFCLALHMHILF